MRRNRDIRTHIEETIAKRGYSDLAARDEMTPASPA